MNTIMQGDQYILPIMLTDSAGNVVTADDVEDVEITIGGIIKTYAKDEILWDGESYWGFPMSQDESFAFPPRIKCQARAKFNGGDIIGVAITTLSVVASESKERL